MPTRRTLESILGLLLAAAVLMGLGIDWAVARLKSLDPVRVWFGHDRETWARGR